MKTYKHLYEQYLSDENIVRAIRECRPRKRSHILIDKMLADTDTWIPVVRSWAIDFKNANHTPKVIYDGVSRKKREIIVPTDKEQIIHHMLMNVFEPVVMKGFYEHAYGSIKGRGAELCKSYIERDIRNKSQIKYFLKMDIRKYYNSINTQILIAKLRKVIKDKKYLAVLEEVINVQPIGLPLGFYTSQMLAQFYLKDFDRFVKEELKAPFYYRYVDDIVIHANSKRYLHTVEQAIIDYLHNELALEVNHKRQVFRFAYIDKNGKQHGRDLDFLGYRFFRNKTILRKSIMLKSTRKAKHIYNKNKFTTYDARQMLSYMAKVDKADVYLMYLKRIKPYVSVKNVSGKYPHTIEKEKRGNGMWYRTEMTDKPELQDTTSSKVYNYDRRNIVEEQRTDEEGNVTTAYVFEERKVKKEDWERYLEMKELKERQDVSDQALQDAILMIMEG